MSHSLIAVCVEQDFHTQNPHPPVLKTLEKVNKKRMLIELIYFILQTMILVVRLFPQKRLNQNLAVIVNL